MSSAPTPTPGEVLSIAIFKAAPGRLDEAVHVLRELDQHLRAKGYSRDVLYQDAVHPGRFVLLRYWRSVEDRAAALQDVDLHDYWAQLAQIIQVEEVFERLEPQNS